MGIDSAGAVTSGPIGTGPLLIAPLFNKPLANGGALNIAGAQVIWTNKLAIDGTIAVVSPVATTPTNISFSFSGTVSH